VRNGAERPSTKGMETLSKPSATVSVSSSKADHGCGSGYWQDQPSQFRRRIVDALSWQEGFGSAEFEGNEEDIELAMRVDGSAIGCKCTGERERAKT
jgi:hypothetical protein